MISHESKPVAKVVVAIKLPSRKFNSSIADVAV
jgi:hypothetical protein